MRIVVHPGLHKTGTTSIQRYLFDVYGSDAPQSIWYPHLGAIGRNPSQTGLVQAFRSSQDAGAALLEKTVAQAESGGTEVLLFSAEGLCQFGRAKLAQITNSLRPHRVEVITTVTSVERQAVSIWQENIKHGSTLDLLGEDQVEAVRQSPLLRPTIVRELLEGFGADRFSVVITDTRAEPEKLFSDFLSAAGLPAASETGAKTRKTNRSNGYVEAEIIRAVNATLKQLQERGYELDVPKIRGPLIRTMKTDTWRQNVEHVPIPTPDAWSPIIEEKVREITAELKLLADEGDIEVFGDLSVISAGR